MDEWILSVLYQQTHSAVSRSTSRRPAQFFPHAPGVMHSVLYSPIVDSISALSSASPTVPIDPAMPASASSSVNARAVYCLGPGVRMMNQSLGGELAARPPAGGQRLSQRTDHQIGGS